MIIIVIVINITKSIIINKQQTPIKTHIIYHMHHSNQQDIQNFIQFKINNKQSSQLASKSYIQSKKYQKILDQHFKQVDIKTKQLTNTQYQIKKVRKFVWNQLLNISNIVEKLQRYRYQYQNQMRIMREYKENVLIQLEKQKVQVLQQQKQLQKQIENSMQQMQQYTKQKQQQLQQLKYQSIKLRQQITQKQPLTKQIKQNTSIIQQITKNIQKITNKKGQKSKQIQEDYHNLQKANQKAMDMLRERQEMEKIESQKKREYIQMFIIQLNQLLAKQDNNVSITDIVVNKQNDNYNKQVNQSSIEVGRKMIQQKSKEISNRDKDKLIIEQKLKQLTQKIIGVNNPNNNNNTRKYPKMYINEQLVDKYLNKLKIVSKQLQQIQKQQKILQNKCNELIKQENSKQKQINNLTATIVKITQNINKK